MCIFGSVSAIRDNLTSTEEPKVKKLLTFAVTNVNNTSAACIRRGIRFASIQKCGQQISSNMHGPEVKISWSGNILLWQRCRTRTCFGRCLASPTVWGRVRPLPHKTIWSGGLWSTTSVCSVMDECPGNSYLNVEGELVSSQPSVPLIRNWARWKHAAQ